MAKDFKNCQEKQLYIIVIRLLKKKKEKGSKDCAKKKQVNKRLGI